MTSNQLITAFVKKSINLGDLDPIDEVYTVNKLLNLLRLDSYEKEDSKLATSSRLDILDALLDYAVENKIIKDLTASRDILASEIMDLITPRPSEVNEEFWENYKESPQLATDEFFKLSKTNNYIKTREIAKNIAFKHTSDYGELEITINLSKPEKDPKEIALAAEKKKSVNYPKNFLVVENEGFKGNLTHPGRSNHRIIRMDLAGDPWGFQYSPYAYYNEHSIFLSIEHRPMNVGPQAIRNLLEITTQLPHYFVGSNAGLPIVGGSILSHDHYQGGHYDFPIQTADYTYKFNLKGLSDVEAGIIDWPMSVIRLRSKDRDNIAKAADKIMNEWKSYSDESVGILAHTGDEPHNAVTPIARRNGDEYELDIVLRNNRTSDKYPEGIFHPHPEVHHIKKENIGLIEVMGLAVLPARLKEELSEVEQFLLGKKDTVADIHQKWAEEIKKIHDEINSTNVSEIVEAAVGTAFQEVLEDAGVFKTNEEGQEAFIHFIETISE
ncbi:MAG: UDP-glucose--hexose-1-phosphate uridylyltransferase [Atopostipes sp.]|nr:UDP-glucose--hexose-1-phosphate uridylyltransferase [Atopostipes sp.]